MTRFSLATRWRTALASSSLLVFLLAFSRGASAQGPYSGCGTLIQAGSCGLMFREDFTGNLYTLLNDAPFHAGDHVYVDGDVGCFDTCNGSGCITHNGIDVCPYTGSCWGDGSGTACPCGNNGAPTRGCANSVYPAGALLVSTGLASISSDSLVLNGMAMPDAPALYFQGTAPMMFGNGIVFGDGKQCVAGTITRLGTKLNVSGASIYPAAGDPRISVRGGVTAPGTRTYQVWYRNAAPFCTSSTFNLTNGVSIYWMW